MSIRKRSRNIPAETVQNNYLIPVFPYSFIG